MSYLNLTATILSGPDKGKRGTVIHYDEQENELTIRFELFPFHIMWIWVAPHETDLKQNNHVRQQATVPNRTGSRP